MAHRIRGDPNKEKDFGKKFGFGDEITFRSAEIDEEIGSTDDRGGVPFHNINFFEGVFGSRCPNSLWTSSTLSTWHPSS